MIYGYARVSTHGQVKGNSLVEQRVELQKNGCEVIIEEQYTGTTTARPKFEELLNRLAKGDKLIVCKLDRFARSLAEGLETIQSLFNKGVCVHVLNMGLLEDTPTGRLIFKILLLVAEFEKDMILERTSAGKQIARTRPGYKEGRPPISRERIKHAMELLRTHTYKETSAMTNISTATLERYKRKENIILLGGAKNEY